VMADGELHVACESRCTAPGAEDSQALAARETLATRHLRRGPV
jgi:hypothetical protein